MITNALTTKESALLQQHERTIKQTQGAFIACGKALAEIRDQKLYRATFSTFEDYCQIVWKWGKERARLLIAGACIADELPAEIQPLIQCERQVRALSKVPKNARAGVVKEAAAMGEVTSQTIAKAAAKVVDPRTPNDNHGCQNFVDPEQVTTDAATLRDATGFAIPTALVPMWNRRGEVQEILKAISQARSAVRRAMQQEDALFRFANMSGTCSELSHSYSQIQLAMPYAVCCTCQGISSEKCVVCKGGGFISKLHYDVSVPEEIKAIRSRSCVL